MKSTLEQLAERELLDLSDIVRRALRDFVRKETTRPGRPNYAHS